MTDALRPLLHQHHECDDALSRLEELVRLGDWASAQRCFRLAEQSMQQHFDLEEKRLFPAFEDATGIRHGPTEVMREEHFAIRELFDNCRSLLTAQDRSALQAELDTLFVLIQQHNVKEENVLYPMCRARVPDLDALLADLAPVSP